MHVFTFKVFLQTKSNEIIPVSTKNKVHKKPCFKNQGSPNDKIPMPSLTMRNILGESKTYAKTFFFTSVSEQRKNCSEELDRSRTSSETLPVNFCYSN
jgi:hypothetical protein